MEQQGNNTQGTGMPYSVNPMVSGQAQSPPDGSTTQPTQPIDLPSGSSSSSSQIPQHHLFAYQQVHPQQDQRLRAFWAHKYEEIQRATDFNNHGLPLARVKKVMKSDPEVCMVSKEASVIIAKACEMFVQELTLRSWNHAEENSRRTLRRSDVAACVATTEIFDFLADVSGVDLNVTGAASGGGGLLPPPAMPPPSEGLPYYYMAGPPQMGAHPTAVYGHQAGPPFMAPQIWPQHPPPPPPPPPPAVMPPPIGGSPYYYMAGPPPQIWPQHPPPPPPPVTPPHSEGLPNFFMGGQPQMGAPGMGLTAVYGQQAGPPFMAPQVWPQHPPPPPPPAGG